MSNSNGKIIIVPHCLMTKKFLSRSRSEMEEVLKVLFDSGTGILQMPCPHLFSIMKKDTGTKVQTYSSGFIDDVTNNKPEKLYTEIMTPLLLQIEKYKQLNFEITGLIGIKNSPVCGIYNPTVKASGSFTILLNKKLRDRGIRLQMAVI